MSKKKQRKRVVEERKAPPHVARSAPTKPTAVVVEPESKAAATERPVVDRMDLGMYRAQLVRDKTEPGRIYVNDLGGA